MSNEYKATILMLLSTLSLSFNGLFAKFLTDEFSLPVLLFLRLFLPAVFMLAVMASIQFTLPNKNLIKPIATRAVCVVGCQLCFLASLSELSLVESVVLFATGPLFIPVLEKLFFNVEVKAVTKLALVATFSGVLLLTIDGSRIVLKPEMLLGLGAGLFNAGSQLSLYRSAKGDMSATAINGWSFLISALLVLPVSVWFGFSQSDRLLMSDPFVYWPVWMGLLGLVFATISNQIFRAKAYKIATSNSQLAPLIFTNLLFTLLWQLVFFDTQLTAEKVAGVALIVGASLMQTFAPKLTKSWVKFRLRKAVLTAE
ncbi:DMT family transporter [Vibrio amylolyticus]|uniref:DMT family transporter n=1 Tax=Vibrio amylolyticus TaxID=2847292 RepID=UPI00354E6D9D